MSQASTSELVVAGLVLPRDVVTPLAWHEIFPQPAPIIIDLGAGDGSFAAQLARTRPDRNVLAVERLKGRIIKTGKRAVREGLQNLRGLRWESAYLMRYLIPPRSVREVHVLFPDPWPKRKHWPRRIIQPDFLAHVARALEPNGLFRFVTDHAGYFESAAPIISQMAGMQPVPINPADYPATDFEQYFRAQGLPIYELRMQRLGPVS